MSDSTLAAITAASTLTGSELIYGTQSGADVKITPTQIQTLAVGNNFTHVTGPTTTVKTFTLPNADATLLYSGGALGTPSSGTLTNCTFPTLNQSTSGNAATATALATARAIYGNNFDGTAALTQIIESTFGGTGNGFTKFSGPLTAEKTFTLPNASATILTDNSAVTVAQGGTGQTSYTDGQLLIGNTATGLLSKAALTAGSNITITNGNGTISIAATGGGSPGGSSGQIQYNNSSAFGGTNLWVTDANTIEKYNSTTAQTLKLYNTRTDASNYERGIFDWVASANTLTIGTQAAGTGTGRTIQVITAGSLCATFNTNQSVTFASSIEAASQGYSWNSTGFQMGSGKPIQWSASAVWWGSIDTGISRSAAGVVAFGNGTAGDGSATIVAKTKAGAPTTSDVPAGTWALIRDTTNTTTKLYYNNAGALQTVALT